MSVAAVKEHDISDAAGMDNVDRAAKHLQDNRLWLKPRV